MTFVDVGNWHLVYFIHMRLHVHYIYSWERWRMLRFDSMIGHTSGFEEAWLLVLDPHHSPPLALYSNLNPNGFLYPVDNPPTSMMYFPSTIASIANCTYSSRCVSSLPRFKDEMKLAYSLLLLSFSISHVHRPWQNWHSNLQIICWTSSSCFVWFGDSSLSTLESTT